jgi:hypothetical protein
MFGGVTGRIPEQYRSLFNPEAVWRSETGMQAGTQRVDDVVARDTNQHDRVATTQRARRAATLVTLDAVLRRAPTVPARPSASCTPREHFVSRNLTVAGQFRSDVRGATPVPAVRANGRLA